MAAQLRELAQNPHQDADEKREVYGAARLLCLALETPFDAMHRLFWSVYQLPMTQVGVDLGLFRALAEDSSRGWSLAQLANKLNADQALLYRILRYLASFGLVSESASCTYQANSTTQWLSTAGAEGGTKHYLKTIGPVAHAFPETLRQQHFQSPANNLDTAFQRAHNTDVSAYSWVPPDPTALPAFFEFMKSQRASQRTWTQSFPVQSLELTQEDLGGDRVLFVDVGGASGHQCISFRVSHPELSGRIVVQDQERVIARIDETELKKHEVEPMAHDFFQPQPIKGAKAYYLRNIMHDWPDGKCVEILKNLKNAMAEDSVILIDENVLPDVGASWKQAQKDIQMMSVLAAVERSVSQWHDLLSSAGLQVKEIHTYDDDIRDSIIEAIPA